MIKYRIQSEGQSNNRNGSQCKSEGISKSKGDSKSESKCKCKGKGESKSNRKGKSMCQSKGKNEKWKEGKAGNVEKSLKPMVKPTFPGWGF